MESDQNNNNPVNDCKGTCKTPIGCSCGKMDKEEHLADAVEKTAAIADVQGLKIYTKSCPKKNGGCCRGSSHKLEVLDWLEDLPEAQEATQMVEVQFKNTRKGYYLNSNNLELHKGDIVAVEATPGHDIGEVTLTGKLVLLQMKKNNYKTLQGEHKRVYRLAKQTDIEKYNEAKSREHETMLKAREIAEELNLNMKISDVEYQGDCNKAIFYYIADERVDFRQLIKVYAERFKVKIEMKQIGARQEAGRVGGIGPCGRELCCSSSVSSFVSVSTSAARFQDISLNPQKLAGQCGKLKCCINYEVDTYLEAQRELPSKEIVLETRDSQYYHFKTDILSGEITYSTSKDFAANTVTISKDRAFEIIRMNRKGKRPTSLDLPEEKQDENKIVTGDILESENINRFDNVKKKKVAKVKPRINDKKEPEEKDKDQSQNNRPKKRKKKFNKPNNNRDRNNNETKENQ
ncbi:MAG: stage 0 sporulation family protein [Dysgonomonas sp.]